MSSSRGLAWGHVSTLLASANPFDIVARRNPRDREMVHFSARAEAVLLVGAFPEGGMGARWGFGGDDGLRELGELVEAVLLGAPETRWAAAWYGLPQVAEELERRGCAPYLETEGTLQRFVASIDALAPCPPSDVGDDLRIEVIDDLGALDRHALDLHAIWCAGVADQPEDEPEIPTFELWRAQADKIVSSGGALIALREGKELVALTALTRSEELCYAELTTVRAEWRGRGLAHLVKARSHEWARARGVARVVTDVRSGNAAMLRVNQRFGFEPVECFIVAHGSGSVGT